MAQPLPYGLTITPQSKRESGYAMQIKRIRILLIDDNVADIQHIQHLFRDSKIKNRLNVIPSGDNAFDYLREVDICTNNGFPDLIMASYGMHWEKHRVVHTLEDDIKLRAIPRIVLYSDDRDYRSVHHVDKRDDLFLVKPFTESALFETVLKVKEFGLSIDPITEDDTSPALV